MTKGSSPFFLLHQFGIAHSLLDKIVLLVVYLYTVQRYNWLLKGLDVSWFQTSLPLTALPLLRLITAYRFRVAALSGHAALAFPPSDIALKLN